MADESCLRPAKEAREAVLLRLFRCMTCREDGEDLIKNALKTLARRYSVDPHYALCKPEGIQDELQDNDLDGRLTGTWPGGWPGQQIVELDNLGDPGAWLAEVFAEPILEVLFGWAWNDEANAAYMAENYLFEIRDRGFPVSSDFEGEPDYQDWKESDEEQVRREFVAFLAHWRERVLQTLEKQHAAELSKRK